ncbi:RWD domain-containing protein 1 [Caerostris extrusa]|uniref:RWD domain-containing protein 1 n=1 Tax=Caerostris extrusa TaxID=172846 RepID=A0AAV4VHY7_CAEEX|nr:RWD domain-containing protein 1 [Caerostris extrusa]
MTDYKEEQRNEIEALESIYSNELKIVSDDPEYSFTVDIKTESLKHDPDDYSKIFCMTEENLGMVMVYTLVSEASEWLNKKIVTSSSEKKEAEERRIREAEEEEKSKLSISINYFPTTAFHIFEPFIIWPVRVTVESFMSWKAKFDQEVAELKKLQAKDEVVSKKLTGRELFEKDRSLVDSDLQFLQDEGEVKVDESLFQELDDLELEEEDEEDIPS